MAIKSFKYFNINESKNEKDNYMFFSNLQHINRMLDEISQMDQSEIDNILNEHDWANDHISKSMESIKHVYNFLLSCLEEKTKKD